MINNYTKEEKESETNQSQSQSQSQRDSQRDSQRQSQSAMCFESLFDSTLSLLISANRDSLPEVTNVLDNIEILYNSIHNNAIKGTDNQTSSISVSRIDVTPNHTKMLKKLASNWLTSLQIRWSKHGPPKMMVVLSTTESSSSIDSEENSTVCKSEQDMDPVEFEELEERVISLLATLANLGGTFFCYLSMIRAIISKKIF
jgi:hypothetical protein